MKGTHLICLGVGMLLLLPAVCGLIRQYRCPRDITARGRWPRWLWLGAAFIYDRLPGRTRAAGKLRAERWADALYPGMKTENLIRRHEIRKIALTYTVLLAAWAAAGLLLLTEAPDELPDGRLLRNDAEGTAVQAEVVARVEDEEVPLTLKVLPRAYTDAELETAAAAAGDYLKEQLPGDNKDLEHVTGPLCLPAAVPDLPFKIEWQPADYRLIGLDGSLYEPEDVTFPVKTSLTALLSYRDRTFSYEYPVTITGIRHTAQETLRIRLAEAVDAADDATKAEDYLKLPDTVEGKTVSWRFKADHRALWLAAVGLGLACGLYYLQDERMRREAARRSEEIRLDYPGFVHQLVLLIGAGLTVRRCWDLMIEDAGKNLIGSDEGRFLYREMLYARRRMQTGVPETEVYRLFGERMAYPGYARICRILVQMIRTGSRGSREMMMKEAEEAERRRRDLARKLGETAGTKLLLPMMMLLFIVLAVIMLPAFLSM